MTEHESLEKLMAYQQDLVAEEECLQKLINKLNAQTHALTVEQFHILNLINKNATTTNNATTSKKPEPNLKKEFEEPKNKELDLTVPSFKCYEEDEEEMEE